jgi:hypothetical protein
VGPKEMYIARQRLGKHVPAAIECASKNRETIGAVFSVGSAPSSLVTDDVT